MAEASLACGYQYIGITDHSKTAHYAGGLTLEEIEQQQAEIDRLNAAFGDRFRIFKGIESDILPDGSLDYSDDVLRRFDFIIGSIHGQFRLDRQAQTERLVRAASNPFVTVIGHMTGRQLLRRLGYDLDFERVLAACAEHGVRSRSMATLGDSISTGGGCAAGSSSGASSALTPMPIRRARSLPRRAGDWPSPGKAACPPTE
jgi:DNA polymerase (family 10)